MEELSTNDLHEVVGGRAQESLAASRTYANENGTFDGPPGAE